ncbi:neutral ceramidase [Planococcus citri]|uniref:neutral ceramidase n=1 Tax=Planococcus citri TaxID=170843 RepID=UPI0031FA194F
MEISIRWLLIVWITFVGRLQALQIGVGIADVTGPSVGIPFMGYANIDQKGQGIHLRQFSRAFIVSEHNQNFVFISVDCGMIGNGLRKEVLKKLGQKFEDLYTVNNVMISGTHTHSAPGGFLMDFLFDVSTLGFNQETYSALTKGIVLSVERAHQNLKPGRIYKSVGILLNANINRSPTAYKENPEAERAKYEYDVDKQMVQLKFIDDNNKPMGMISWFAVHPTSMNYTNTLISTDNVGYASILFEKKMNPKGSLIGKGPFVAAFASTNLGDVSPNIMGARCQLTGNECEPNSSRCGNEKDLCIANGPGQDMFESTKIIAERLYGKALELWNSKSTEVTGDIRTIHQYVHMPSQTAKYTDPITKISKIVTGCLPAMGHSFAAGTTDGPGLFSFKQSQTMPDNPLWNMLTSTLATPSLNQTTCHGIKPILLTTGEMKFPFQWQPDIVSTQLALVGKIAIVCVPGEFTTMSGRRLRTALRKALQLEKDTDVIIAGLCNTYSDYITTPEEYQVQRYEGASTIFGPYTLPLYISQFEKLASKLKGVRGDMISPGPTPAEFFNKLISLAPPVVFDNPQWDYNFGDCTQQPPASVKIGSTVSVKFVAGHPRNNLRHEDTYLTVELLDGDWTVIATDADWETKFIWRRLSFFAGTSEVEIKWTIEPHVKPGYYRIRHFGTFKYISGSKEEYNGTTQVFKVTKF